jgi:hypothetical protein
LDNSLRKASAQRLPLIAAALFFLISAALLFASGGAHAMAPLSLAETGVPFPVATVPTSVATATATAQAAATNTPQGATRTPTHTYTPVSSPTQTRTPAPPSPQPTGQPTACALNFSDVHTTDWFYPYVSFLFCRGAISGYADGTFRPGNTTTRGQIAKIVVLGERWTLNTSGGPHFSDVPATHAFYIYVETAYNHGAISGYADGTFRPGYDVTRGQLTKIVVGARGWTTNTGGGPHFSDVPVGSTFYAFVETAYNHGVISGYADGTFRPGNSSTRAQLSKIVSVALQSP